MEKHLKRKNEDDNIDTNEMIRKMMSKINSLSDNVHKIEKDQDIELRKREEELKSLKQKEFWRMKRIKNEEKEKEENRKRKDKEENDKN